MTERKEYRENEFARFWIEQGVLFFEYKEGAAIDLAAATRIVEDRILLQNERTLPILCDIRGLASVDKAGRDYLANSGSLLAGAVALVVNENVSMTVSSFYLAISRPAVPTSIFTSMEEALEYLGGFREGNANLKL